MASRYESRGSAMLRIAVAIAASDSVIIRLFLGCIILLTIFERFTGTMGPCSNSLLKMRVADSSLYRAWGCSMAQFYGSETEDRDRSAWSEAVAETAPELMPEKLPPEFSPVPFPQAVVKRKRRRVELPKIKRP